MMWLRCACTVLTLSKSCSAISWLVWPAPISARIWRSRGVSMAWAARSSPLPIRCRYSSTRRFAIGGGGETPPRGGARPGAPTPVPAAALTPKPGGAGFQDTEEVVLGLVDGEDEDADRRIDLGDPPRRREAIELRHPDVHEHDVGPHLDRAIDRLAPVRGLGDHVEATLPLQEGAQPLPPERVGVGGP